MLILLFENGISHLFVVATFMSHQSKPDFRGLYSSYIYSFRKPVHIPSAGTLYISYYKFEAFEVKRCDRIKTDVE